MARFRFKLQSVLENRIFLEESAENELAQAQAQLRKAEENLAECRRKAAEADKLQKKKLAGGTINVQELVVLLEYSVALSQQAEQLKELVKRAQQMVEAKKEALLEARQAREALDKVREREFMSWQKRVLKLEQKLLDEMAIGIYRRHEAEGR